MLSDEALAHLRRVADEPDLSGTRYRVVGVAGRGGMGTVYRVEDATLEREVALKVLDLADGAGELAARLLEEARALARLEHPGIVPVHDAGVLRDGRAFYAMKLVAGESLADRAPGLSLAEHLDVFKRVAETVAFAHSRGVLHRDLTPSNVMLGAFGEVLVMDWGLAKVLGASDRPFRAAARRPLYLSGEILRTVLPRFESKRLAKALDAIEPDDAARLLEFLPEEKRAPVLDAMSAKDAAAARGLLKYPPGTAGRLMTGKFVKVAPEWTVGEALRHLKEIDPEVATVAVLYAVDKDGKLVGVLSLRKLLPESPEKKIADVMTTEVVSVPPDAPHDLVAGLVSKYGFNALPVVSADGKALGIITVDDVVDLLVAKETQNALRMGGVASGGEPWERRPLDYFNTAIVKVVKMRIGWLLLLFVAETMTGTVLRHFEDELAKVVALSFFIPLIIGTGGNTGGQTVSTIIRALALGQVRVRDVMRVLARETTSGLMLGALLCVAAFG